VVLSGRIGFRLWMRSAIGLECCNDLGEVAQPDDSGPGVALIACLADGPGDPLLSLGDEAGQGGQADRAVAKPVRGVQRGEAAGGFVDDAGAELVEEGCGQLAGLGEPQRPSRGEQPRSS
jgi:hypothetical protein